MSKHGKIVAQLVFVGLVLGLGMLLSACADVPAPVNREPLPFIGAGIDDVPLYDASSPTVDVRTASGVMIEFKTQNGQTVGVTPPQSAQIPHLVLHHNGTLTAAAERTLVVRVSGVEVPTGGVTVTLSIETQHGDPDLGDSAEVRIPVWYDSVWLVEPDAGTAEFTVEFPATLVLGSSVMPTPTGYYRYRVTVTGSNDATLRTLAEVDYAFLMENQVVIALPSVQEITEGAAPDELIVYYCDMFPYQNRNAEGTTRLRRADVPDYVERVLVPQAVEAFRAQTDVWGFPWFEAWTSFSGGENAERLTLILGDGQRWFHGWSPTGGHAGIALDVRGNLGGATYASLTDRLMAVFQHELFHNLQRNLAQHYGGHTEVAGAESAWDFFSEGTAVLASSVGEPEAEFGGEGTYLLNANKFIGGGGLSGNLNVSYAEMRAYMTTIYWRFLYEQCGGMQIVREALVALYTGDIVDIRTSTDVVGNLPAIMDRAMANAACPFTTYQDSLSAFARALYALHLEDGRCGTVGQSGYCGFYDPNRLYSGPTVERVHYSGRPLHYGMLDHARPAGVPTSYGMDFIEIDLDPATAEQPLTVEVYGASRASAQFSVQVWALAVEGRRARPVNAPVTLVEAAEGHVKYTMPPVDRQTAQRLVVIVTRVDALESLDPVGAYTLEVYGAAAP